MNQDGPQPKDRWWIVAFVFAIYAMIQVGLVFSFPDAIWTWLLAVGVLTFTIVMWFHPENRHYRRASYLFAAAGVTAIIPTVLFTIDLKQLGGVRFESAGSTLIPIAYLIAGTIHSWFDFQRDRPEDSGASGIESETFTKIVNRYESQIDELQERIGILEEVKAGIERIEELGAAGNTQAKAAIEEARADGDIEKLQALLIEVADQAQQQLESDENEFIEMCREIAATAYLRGDIVEAEKRLQIIINRLPDDFGSTSLLGHIQRLRGELKEAEFSFRRLLELAANDEGKLADAFNNLGVIYHIRGELSQAEQMYRKALKINEKLGKLKDIAINYGNLGVIYQVRGELDQAEQMVFNSIKISEQIGSRTAMANGYGNLGLIYKTRGKLEQAEQMYHKSLKIHEEFGNLKDIAINYGNLGVIYQIRGELDQAEQMHRKALNIAERIGRPEGVATEYCCLGVIYRRRGRLDLAEQMLRESLKINEQLGKLEGIAIDYANLGEIYLIRGELDKAEQLLRKSLRIEKQLGRLEGMASDYKRLGVIYQNLGELDQSRKYLNKAKSLFEKVGMQTEIQQVQGWLDSLEDEESQESDD